MHQLIVVDKECLVDKLSMLETDIMAKIEIAEDYILKQ